MHYVWSKQSSEVREYWTHIHQIGVFWWFFFFSSSCHYSLLLFFWKKRKKKCSAYFVVQWRFYAHSYWLSLTHTFKLSSHKAKCRSGREMLPPPPPDDAFMGRNTSQTQTVFWWWYQAASGTLWWIAGTDGRGVWENSAPMKPEDYLLWMCRHRSGIMRRHCVGGH